MSNSGIRYRSMILSDMDTVPLDCHGSRPDVEARINDIGSAAVLAFDAQRHVGQLQFRRYSRTARSAEGIWHPDYWGDFGAWNVELPGDTLNVFCYHVGQLGDGDDRDSSYFGRGIGLEMLDYFIDWARRRRAPAIVAKFTPEDRRVMAFMGGMPEPAYAERGFEVISRWFEPQLWEALLSEEIVPADSDREASATVGMCLLNLA